MSRPWKATEEEEKEHGEAWADFAAWRRWLDEAVNHEGVGLFDDGGHPLAVHLYAAMCYLADGDQGEPTGKTYTLRTETLQDIVNTVPPERFGAVMADLLDAATAAHLTTAAVQATAESLGFDHQALQTRMRPTMEWRDDSKVGGEIHIRLPKKESDS